VYGRRRIGKTFLIREYFGGKFDFYVTGLANGTNESDDVIEEARQALIRECGLL